MKLQQTALLCLILAMAACCLGCGTYGETSPLAYEHAKSLYTACNQQKPEVLERVGQRIAAARDANEISAEEASWLTDIVDTARSGNWKSACQECRELMEAQVTGKP